MQSFGNCESSRRRFLGLSAAMANAILCGGADAHDAAESPTGQDLPRVFPLFPRPRELWIVPAAGDVEEGMLLESAAGLAARASLAGESDALIYEDVAHDAYQRWFQQYCREHRPRLERMPLDDAIARLAKAQAARGWLLYRFEQSVRPLHAGGNLDESVNVATSLSANRRGLVVSERLARRVEALGLKRLADLRDRTEAWCLAGREFSRDALGTSDPKSRNARSLMIAMGTFVCSGRGEVYEKALSRCNPDTPVIGWGCEDEAKQTMPSSRWALFQTATNWCHNLPVFASEGPGRGIPAEPFRHPHPRHWSSLDWGDGRHHANFTLTDGDNVQWLMGGFLDRHQGPSYFMHPRRGRIPFGWGLPVPSLCQLSPRTLTEVLRLATPNDDFALFSGGGYFYPDLYGANRKNRDALQLHARRLRAYMDLTGIRVVAFNFQDWDSPEAVAACNTIASQMPGLLGILAFQYYPYSGGEGAIRWARGASGDEVPVVSCRLCIWANTGRPRDTTPGGVAAQLNRLPPAAGLAGDAAFSWILAHAWSRFRDAPDAAPPDAEEKDVAQDRETPGTHRGYEPVLWAARRLAPHVRPVTIQELLLRIRLRLRTKTTLVQWLGEVERDFASGRTPAPPLAVLQQLRSKIVRLADTDPAAARECFEQLLALRRPG